MSGAGIPALPPVIGHRGAAAFAPENTLAAFRKAKELGAAWVEFDVRLTRDGRVILLHDDRIDRTTDGKGAALDLAFAEIRRYDAGSWFSPAFAGETVPSFEEAMECLGELGLGANIELKPAYGTEAATAEAVAALLRARWPDHLPPPLLSSFAPTALEVFAAAAPHYPRGYLCVWPPRNWRRHAESLGCVTIHCDHRRLDRDKVRKIRDAGYPLLTYTVNDSVRGRELLAWGVTSLFTDRPDLLYR